MHCNMHYIITKVHNLLVTNIIVIITDFETHFESDLDLVELFAAARSLFFHVFRSVRDH